MVEGFPRPPNEKWMRENEGEQLVLEYEGKTYVVAISEVTEDND